MRRPSEMTADRYGSCSSCWRGGMAVLSGMACLSSAVRVRRMDGESSKK